MRRRAGLRIAGSVTKMPKLALQGGFEPPTPRC
jgi:hypothetical protein